MCVPATAEFHPLANSPVTGPLHDALGLEPARFWGAPTGGFDSMKELPFVLLPRRGFANRRFYEADAGRC